MPCPRRSLSFLVEPFACPAGLERWCAGAGCLCLTCLGVAGCFVFVGTVLTGEGAGGGVSDATDPGNVGAEPGPSGGGPVGDGVGVGERIGGGDFGGDTIATPELTTVSIGEIRGEPGPVHGAEADVARGRRGRRGDILIGDVIQQRLHGGEGRIGVQGDGQRGRAGGDGGRADLGRTVVDARAIESDLAGGAPLVEDRQAVISRAAAGHGDRQAAAIEPLRAGVAQGRPGVEDERARSQAGRQRGAGELDLAAHRPADCP